MVVPACCPSTEKKAGEAGVQGHPSLHSEFEATLGHMRSHLKNKLIKSEAEMQRKADLCEFQAS